jgi:predicted nucleic acid-binding protein
VILLDTTILVYAVGSEHGARDPSRRLLEAIGAGRVAATTTVEVIQEFVRVYARRRARAAAVELARRYVTLLTPLLVAGEHELDHGLKLFESQAELGAFDAVLAATALSHGADALVSADQSFASVPGLAHVAPGSDAFEFAPGHVSAAGALSL